MPDPVPSVLDGPEGGAGSVAPRGPRHVAPLRSPFGVGRPELSTSGEPLRRLRVLGPRDWPWLTAFVVLFAGVSVLWLLRLRSNGPLDIDESGYASYALADYHALRHGLGSWLAQVVSPSIQAPMSIAVSSLLIATFGTSPVVALSALVAFTSLTVVLTFLLGRRLMSRGAAWSATILVATTPLVINYGRSYELAAAATAMTVLALYCYERSQRLESLRWSIAFGASIGLMVSARTMTVAYYPAFVVACLVAIAISTQRRRTLRHAGAAAAAAIVVASGWLLPHLNVKGVVHYLTAYGYGEQATAFGNKAPIYTPQAWIQSAHIFLDYVYLPHFLIFLASGVVAIAVAVQRLRGVGVRTFLASLAAWPLLPSALLVLEGFAALTSSSNQGTGFSEPIVPALCVLSAWALHTLVSRRFGPAPVAAVLCVALLAALPSLPIRWGLAGEWSARIPGTDTRVTITSGHGLIDENGAPTMDGLTWRHINEKLADDLDEGTPAAIAFRHFWLNNSSILYVRSLPDQPRIFPVVLVPMEITDTVERYTAWLSTGQAAQACRLATATGIVNSFGPPVTDSKIREAATAAGFVPISSTAIPDGGEYTIWRRADRCHARN